MKTPGFALAVALIASAYPALAHAEDCASLIAQAESSQGPEAVASAKKAVAVCKIANIKTARPFMVLSAEANRSGKLNEVISWSKQGLEQEPSLPLAYMNICAAQMQMKKYDDAVATCQQGLREPNAWSAKLNFNIGLALFKKAVDAQKFPETLKSEPYFQESKQLDASILQNDFYLGMMEENVKGNPQAALSHYEPACKAGDKSSCEAMARVKSATSAPAVSAKTAAPASPEEAKLWDELVVAYRKKGLDEATAKHTVSEIRGNFSSLTSEQRIQSLKSMLEALK